MTIIVRIAGGIFTEEQCWLSCAEDLNMCHLPGLCGVVSAHWCSKWYHTFTLYRHHLSQTMSYHCIKTKCHLQLIRKKEANPNPSSLTFLQHPHLKACSSRRKAGSTTGIKAKGHLQCSGKGRQMGCLTVKGPCYDSTQPFHRDRHQMLRRRSCSQWKGRYLPCWKIFVTVFPDSMHRKQCCGKNSSFQMIYFSNQQRFNKDENKSIICVLCIYVPNQY